MFVYFSLVHGFHFFGIEKHLRGGFANIHKVKKNLDSSPRCSMYSVYIYLLIYSFSTSPSFVGNLDVISKFRNDRSSWWVAFASEGRQLQWMLVPWLERKGNLMKSPLLQGNLGWWNMTIWSDMGFFNFFLSIRFQFDDVYFFPSSFVFGRKPRPLQEF